MNKSVIAGMVDVREDKGVVETDYYVREFFLRNRYRLFVDADVLIHPAAPKCGTINLCILQKGSYGSWHNLHCIKVAIVNFALV